MNNADNRQIWIFAQTDSTGIKASFYQLLSKTRQLVASMATPAKTAAVFLGEPDEAALKAAKSSGVDFIYIAEHPKLAVYNPDYYISALYALTSKYRPDAFWIPASSIGSEIAPAVACRLKTGLVAHGVDMYMHDGSEYVIPVPAFGGKYLSEELCPEKRPVMATFKEGLFEAEPPAAFGKAEIIVEHINDLDGLESRIEYRGSVSNPVDTLPIDKADFVICGGLGASDEATYKKLGLLAERCNAVLGHTRPIIDIGLEDTEDRLIGTSGKSIHPKVYLSFGVSGASHHMFGVKGSNVIIAVNNDPRAEIFGACDIKAVADADAVVSACLKELTS